MYSETLNTQTSQMRASKYSSLADTLQFTMPGEISGTICFYIMYNKTCDNGMHLQTHAPILFWNFSKTPQAHPFIQLPFNYGLNYNTLH